MSETLPAPDVAIALDASGSSGICIDGQLQYRFSIEGGSLLRDWGDGPIVIDAPFEKVSYLVEARCSTDTSCLGSALVQVDVACPTAGTFQEPFPEVIQAQGNKTDWSWTTPLDFDRFTGDLDAVSNYEGDLTSATGSSFSDMTLPLSGAGFYYVLRESGEFCNTRGLWTSEGAGESTTREGSLP